MTDTAPASRMLPVPEPGEIACRVVALAELAR